jgi:serine/threonine protein kinase
MAKTFHHYQPNDEPVPGYRLVEKMAAGGFGEVWKAVGPGDMHCALKIIDISEKQGRLELKSLRYVRELRDTHLVALHAFWLKDRKGQILPDRDLWSTPSPQPVLQVTSPSAALDPEDTTDFVVQLSPHSEEPAELLIAMQLGSKSLLSQLKEDLRRGLQGIPRDLLLRYMADAARGIDFLHHQSPPILHRDVKPANILLVGNGAAVCDFGLAKATESLRKTVGTPMTVAYAAPETFDPQIDLTPMSDQYSLAISYIELRTGRLPFPERLTSYQVMRVHEMGSLDLSALAPAELPVIRRATDRDPTKRFSSCEEMVEALREACGRPRAPLVPPPVSPVSPPPLPPQVDRTTRNATGDETPQQVPSEIIRLRLKPAKRSWRRTSFLSAGLAVAALAVAIFGFSSKSADDKLVGGAQGNHAAPSEETLSITKQTPPRNRWIEISRSWEIAVEARLQPLLQQVQFEDNIRKAIELRPLEACLQIENATDIAWRKRSAYRELARRNWITGIETLFGTHETNKVKEARTACTQILRFFPFEPQVHLLRARTAFVAADFAAVASDLGTLRSLRPFPEGRRLALALDFLTSPDSLGRALEFHRSMPSREDASFWNLTAFESGRVQAAVNYLTEGLLAEVKTKPVQESLKATLQDLSELLPVDERIRSLRALALFTLGDGQLAREALGDVNAKQKTLQDVRALIDFGDSKIASERVSRQLPHLNDLLAALPGPWKETLNQRLSWSSLLERRLTDYVRAAVHDNPTPAWNEALQACEQIVRAGRPTDLVLVVRTECVVEATDLTGNERVIALRDAAASFPKMPPEELRAYAGYVRAILRAADQPAPSDGPAWDKIVDALDDACLGASWPSELQIPYRQQRAAELYWQWAKQKLSRTGPPSIDRLLANPFDEQAALAYSRFDCARRLIGPNAPAEIGTGFALSAWHRQPRDLAEARQAIEKLIDADQNLGTMAIPVWFARLEAQLQTPRDVDAFAKATIACRQILALYQADESLGGVNHAPSVYKQVAQHTYDALRGDEADKMPHAPRAAFYLALEEFIATYPQAEWPFDRGDMRISLLKQALDADPTTTDLRGLVYLDESRRIGDRERRLQLQDKALAAAQEALDAASGSDPRRPAYLVQLSGAYRARANYAAKPDRGRQDQDLADAKRHAGEALELEQKDHMVTDRALTALGAACEDSAWLLQQDRQAKSEQPIKAFTARKQADFEQAINCFDEAILKRPSVQNYCHLGRCLYKYAAHIQKEAKRQKLTDEEKKAWATRFNAVLAKAEDALIKASEHGDHAPSLLETPQRWRAKIQQLGKEAKDLKAADTYLESAADWAKRQALPDARLFLEEWAEAPLYGNDQMRFEQVRKRAKGIQSEELSPNCGVDVTKLAAFLCGHADYKEGRQIMREANATIDTAAREALQQKASELYAHAVSEFDRSIGLDGAIAADRAALCERAICRALKAKLSDLREAELCQQDAQRAIELSSTPEELAYANWCKAQCEFIAANDLDQEYQQRFYNAAVASFKKALEEAPEYPLSDYWRHHIQVLGPWVDLQSQWKRTPDPKTTHDLIAAFDRERANPDLPAALKEWCERQSDTLKPLRDWANGAAKQQK